MKNNFRGCSKVADKATRTCKLTKKISDAVGNPIAIFSAFALVIGWLITGHYFNYSNTWQLIINTSTSIITFLIVFIIQNSQNRDTEILNLKLDELICSQRSAKNNLINVDELSDEELKHIEKEYKKLKNKTTGD